MRGSADWSGSFFVHIIHEDQFLMFLLICTLQKHTYSDILRSLPKRNWNFLVKNSNIFQISDQNIDCGYSLEPPRQGGSNEYPRSMFLSRNKKNNVYPCKPQLYYLKVGFKGVNISWCKMSNPVSQPVWINDEIFYYMYVYCIWK